MNIADAPSYSQVCLGSDTLVLLVTGCYMRYSFYFRASGSAICILRAVQIIFELIALKNAGDGLVRISMKGAALAQISMKERMQ